MRFVRQASGTGAASGPTFEIGPCLDSAGAEYNSLVIGDLTLTKNGTSAAMAANATLTATTNGRYSLVMIGNNADTLGSGRISCNKVTYQIPPVDFTVLTAAAFDTLITNGTLASTTSGRTIDTDASGKLLLQATQTGVTIPTVTTLTNAPSDSSGVTTLLSRLSSTRAGYLDNLSAGAVATAAALDAVDNLIDTEIADLSSRLPAALVGGRMNSDVRAWGGFGSFSVDPASDIPQVSALSYYDLGEGEGRLFPSDFADLSINGGRVDATSTLAANAITAASTAADYITEISDLIDARMVAIGLDHLLSTSVTGTDVADNSIFARLASKSATADWDTFVNTSDSLEAARDNQLVAASAAITTIQIETASVGSIGYVVELISDKIGPFSANSDNNILGFLRSMARSDYGPAPDDMEGSYAGSVHSLMMLSTLAFSASTSLSTLIGDTTDIQTEIAEVQATLAGLFTTALTESYRADGATGSVAQLLYEINQIIGERAFSATTGTVKKIDGITTALTQTINDAGSPTSITRAT